MHTYRDEPMPMGAKVLVTFCKAVTIAAVLTVAAGLIQDTWNRQQAEEAFERQAREEARQWREAVKKWNENAPQRAKLRAEYAAAIQQARNGR